MGLTGKVYYVLIETISRQAAGKQPSKGILNVLKYLRNFSTSYHITVIFKFIRINHYRTQIKTKQISENLLPNFFNDRNKVY